ncbi:putative low molecular weight phosphotyrosine protein phosphatase protein [Neofusicoccum parvum UCRNP2]|uniref:protein-tyrosine-phosphatase n=2 Tax=Neofusicoccum parvum TaxID=310453 RepID=R1GP39_BOTPV|nr:putative low molecular weight phosphotyrosine protein phosphatase protein [Neofusicoccum parvum UCRNP2]GME21827.1 Protein-tyrosine phosphatase/arsenate reductase [Neofusicoccum parvum]
MAIDGKANILFVCLGNICITLLTFSPFPPATNLSSSPGRSTMAEGVFRSLTKTPSPHPTVGEIDSCGTGAYHAGDGPDSRTMSTLEDHGITDYDHCARKFANPDDFHRFDYILAMDRENLSDLQRLRQAYERKLKAQGKESEIAALGKVMMFGDFGGKKGEVIIDPYYGGRDGFDTAYKQAVRFSQGLLKHLEEERA